MVCDGLSFSKAGRLSGRRSWDCPHLRAGQGPGDNHCRSEMFRENPGFDASKMKIDQVSVHIWCQNIKKQLCLYCSCYNLLYTVYIIIYIHALHSYLQGFDKRCGSKSSESTLEFDYFVVWEVWTGPGLTWWLIRQWPCIPVCMIMLDYARVSSQIPTGYVI